MTIQAKKSKISAISLAIAGIVCGVQSYAEENSSEEDKLETVEIVGKTTNTEITPLELEKLQANDLADVFRKIPSVSVGGSLGLAQKVYIRGLEDTLLNVTVDGAIQTGTLFHHIGRVQIEPELLEKVEVQTGAGEATAGAGAIGGAIRFKTKDVDDLLERGENFGFIVKANTFSNDGERGNITAYGKVSDKVGLLASYTQVDRDNMEDGNGSEIFGTAAEQSLAFFKFNSEISNNQSLSLSYEERDESGEMGRRPNWVVLESDPLYPVDGERKTLVGNYEAVFSEGLNLQVTLYDTQSDFVQDGPFGLYGGKTSSTGFDIRNKSILGDHNLTYGADFRDDEVKAGPRGAETIQEYIDAGWVTSLAEKGKVTGVYIQDHWSVLESLTLSFGMRYDKYELEQINYNTDIEDDGFSPNIGLSYAFTDELHVFAGHARARRGKEIGDAFTLEESFIAPDITSEKVKNNEIGLEYNGNVFAATLSAYQSTIEDVIYDQLGRGTLYENNGELEMQGFEFLVAANLENWYLAASAAFQDTEINGNTVEGYEHNGVGNSRGDTYTLEAEYSFSTHWAAGWHFTYVDALEDIEVLQRGVELGWISETQFVDKPSYELHDIFVRWTPFNDDSLSLNFAVQNVFNEQYRDHSSVADYSDIPDWEIVRGVFESGRDIRFTISYKY